MLQAQLSLIPGKEGLGFLIPCQMDRDKDTVVELAGKTDCLLGMMDRTCSVVLFYKDKIESVHTDIYLFIPNLFISYCYDSLHNESYEGFIQTKGFIQTTSFVG